MAVKSKRAWSIFHRPSEAALIFWRFKVGIYDILMVQSKCSSQCVRTMFMNLHAKIDPNRSYWGNTCRGQAYLADTFVTTTINANHFSSVNLAAIKIKVFHKICYYLPVTTVVSIVISKFSKSLQFCSINSFPTTNLNKSISGFRKFRIATKVHTLQMKQIER